MPLSDNIKFDFWLTFNARGAVRVTKGQPDISRNERTMKMVATLPRALFVLPELRGTITIPPGGAEEFRVDVQAASEALKGVVGVDIDLRVFGPTPNESGDA